MIMTAHKKIRISFTKKYYILNCVHHEHLLFELILWKSKQIHAPDSRVMFIIEHNIGKL